MLYKGNFCAECGEKIETEDFRLTNRFLCEKCASARGTSHLFAPLVLLVSMLGGGFFLGSIGQNPKTPVALISNQANIATQNSNAPQVSKQENQTQSNKTTTEKTAPTPNFPTQKPAQNPPIVQNQPTEVAKKSPNPLPQIVETNEATYYCGAKTLKGTPCMRKVKGGGRCWQHPGKPAMYPPERLLIQP